jgi:hypothetical protein
MTQGFLAKDTIKYEKNKSRHSFTEWKCDSLIYNRWGSQHEEHRLHRLDQGGDATVPEKRWRIIEDASWHVNRETNYVYNV